MKNIFSYILLVCSLIMVSCEEEKEIKVYTLPVYKNLYLVGDATPAGWNIGEPSPMTVNPENGFEHTWEGVLLMGQFKIPTRTGDWGCDYFMPTTDGESDFDNATCQLVKGGNPDFKWVVTQPGKYKITINIEDLDKPVIDFELMEALPDYPNLYIIGSATPAGWDISNPVAMEVDASSAFIHNWTGELVEGELKFMTGKDWGAAQFVAINANEEDLTKTTCQLVQGGPDNKWLITASTAGTYQIVLNITNSDNPTVTFTKQ